MTHEDIISLKSLDLAASDSLVPMILFSVRFSPTLEHLRFDSWFQNPATSFPLIYSTSTSIYQKMGSHRPIALKFSAPLDIIRRKILAPFPEFQVTPFMNEFGESMACIEQR